MWIIFKVFVEFVQYGFYFMFGVLATGVWDLHFPGGSVVKNPPANAGDEVQSPGQEDPLKEEMAAHSSILAWEIPWTEEPGGLQSMGLQKSLT